MTATESLSERFSDLYCGRGVWAGLSPSARLLLAALLTSDVHQISRDEVDRIMEPMGRYAVSTVLAELKSRGFLAVERSTGRSGLITWVWKVSMTPEVAR